MFENLSIDYEKVLEYIDTCQQYIYIYRKIQPFTVKLLNLRITACAI